MKKKKLKAIKRILFRQIDMEPTRYIKDPKTGAIYCTGYRRAYQDAKRELKRLKHETISKNYKSISQSSKRIRKANRSKSIGNKE